MKLSEYIPRSELIVKENIKTMPRFDVIDVHSHFGDVIMGPGYAGMYDTRQVVEALKANGVKKIINLDGYWGGELDKILAKIRPYNDFVITFGSVDVKKFENKDFEKYVKDTMAVGKKKGIKGIKFLKEASLRLRDGKGMKVPITDKRLKIIWETASELQLPVMIHIGDPVAFFRPLDRYNERYEELCAHPNWHFHGPDFYGFDELMDMQEDLLSSNPDTTFIVAHGGSYTENLDFVGRCLDRYPNMSIDIAMRISEFGRQPHTSRDFFIKYQDRILFATDGGPLSGDYQIYYRFLETFDEYFDYSSLEIPPQGRWKIYGIGLDDIVLEKVYNLNAQKLIR